MGAITLIISCLLIAFVGEANWIRVQIGGRPQLFSPDGIRQPAVLIVPEGHLSPDGSHLLRVKAHAIYVSSTEGRESRQISPDKMMADWPSWSPDGKRIAFVGICEKHWQVHVVDSDGQNVRQVTNEPEGAWRPQFGPDGSLAYLAQRQPIGKLQVSDLLISDGLATKTAVKAVFINDYAWSPDGKTIAYSKLGSLIFHDLKTGAEQECAFVDIDERLSSHVAARIAWRPDGQVLACAITFLGGRQQGGPQMFGDRELFVIPRRGKPTWIATDGDVERIEWVKSPQPAKAQ